MLLWSCFTASADSLFVYTSVEIVNETGVEWVHTSERSKESLQDLHFDWWDRLPIMYRFADFPSYSEALLSAEGDRLLEWYTDHGWRDAVVTYEVVPYKEMWLFPGPRKHDAYAASFSVLLGSEWTLDTVTFNGLVHDGDEIPVPTIAALPMQWSRSVQVEADDQLRLELGRRGYANPTIHWQSSVLRPLELGLEAYVEWGEEYTFGDVEIVNDAGERWPILQSTLPGRDFSIDKVDLLLHRVEQLPAVAAVQVEQEIDSENREVNLTVRATPNNTRTVKGVGGFTTQATAWAFDGGVAWDIRNRTAPSVLIAGRHTGGYRTFPQGLDLSHDGWATQHDIETIWSLIPKYGFSFLAQGEALWDLQMGYQESLFLGHVGGRFNPHPFWTIDVTYGKSNHVYRPVVSQQEMFELWFDEGGLQSSVDSSEASLRLTRLNPQHSFLNVAAIPFGLMNGVPFQRVHLRAEHHLFNDRWLWRNRTEVGLLRWMDETSPKLLHNRFFLGGGQSQRGWSYNKVHAPGYQGKHFDVNLGGDKAVFLSTELQYTLVSEYRVLTFLDVGRVWENWDDPMPWNEWYPSTGIGLIVPTMVGDVAFTEAVGLYRDTELLHNPSRFVFHCILVRELGG